MYAPQGRIPGVSYAASQGTGNAYADRLRAAGIVEDRDAAGLAAHKRRLSRRGGRWLTDALGLLGTRSHDNDAGRAELGGYAWTGPPAGVVSANLAEESRAADRAAPVDLGGYTHDAGAELGGGDAA